ncbi:MAG TPA: hypothetical protein VJR25_05425 [Microbacterium sp.]|nr:hypothetical protein [Microbacterium sp.]HKT56194.1 hypothetical protein [Microbacterium sp.]
MSASEQSAAPAAATEEEPQPTPLLATPLTMIADGASCTIDGICDPV